MQSKKVQSDVPNEVLEFIEQRSQSQEYSQRALRLLLEILDIDTTPHSDIAIMRENEEKAYNVIRKELADIHAANLSYAFIPFNPEIAEHAAYTQPHYTKTTDNPDGLSVEETYNGRGNLVAVLSGDSSDPSQKRRLAFNSHIDVIAPSLPSKVEGDIVHGRGACDAKGQVVAMLTQIRLLNEVREQLGVSLTGDVIYHYVTDEEPGGNGSLTLAVDDPQPFDAVVVHEITQLKLHPANRGALWYKGALKAGDYSDKVNLAEMAAYVVLSLENEGAKIKDESDHPLFPTRPVHTNHGVIGVWGEHPSAINHKVVLNVSLDSKDRGSLEKTVDKAVEEYCSRYGDKTKETDPQTGKPKVDHHWDLAGKSQGDYALAVHGKAGHMGAILECDGAITKIAYVIKALMDARSNGDLQSLTIGIDQLEPSSLILEGGQGFVPTHEIQEIQERLTKAIRRGVKEYCNRVGVDYDGPLVTVTFEKLHNDSYERPLDSPAMEAAVYACEQSGLWSDEPILGWNVSCDARLFAKGFPDRDVITFGPGSLEHAHSAEEQVRISDILKAVEMTTVMTLAYCGFE